jgi:hypothetical protein
MSDDGSMDAKDHPVAEKKARKQRTPSAPVGESNMNGTRLIRAINARATELDYDVKTLAKTLGMSYSYFNTLANEPWRLGRIDRVYMRAIAKFLGINTVLAYQYAGFLEEEDFDVDVTMDRLLDNLRNSIEADPVFAMYTPTKEVWKDLPKSVKLMTMSFYGEVQRLRHQVFNEENE